MGERRRSFTQEDETEEQEGEDGDEPMLAEEKRLVPLLDMLQHDTAPNVRHVLQTDPDTGAQCVVVTARRSISADEELLNCYDFGEPLEPAKFLTRFGFVPGETVGDFVKSIGGGAARLPFGFRVDL